MLLASDRLLLPAGVASLAAERHLLARERQLLGESGPLLGQSARFLGTGRQLLVSARALKAARNDIAALLALAKAVYNAMLAHANLFPQANPSLAVLGQLIQDLEAAPQATFTRAKGTVAVRDAKRDTLITALESERMYVQSLCDASPEQAEMLITAAGMASAKPPVHAKAVLDAEVGPVPGSVKLTANATLLVGRGVRKRPTFNWQFSADGGKTWTSAPSTPLAGTVIEGLTPMTTYAFRVSVTVGTTPGEWSQAVTLLVR